MPEDNKAPEAPKTETKPASHDDSNDTLMGILAYLGILCLIPYLAAKDSEFAQYHAKQGLTLFLCEVVVYVAFWILAFIFWPLFLFSWLLGVGFLVLSIIGIVNVVNKKMVPLPITGSIHIIK